MRIIYLTSLMFFFLIGIHTQAQIRRCATTEHMLKLRNENPSFAAQLDEDRKRFREYLKNNSSVREPDQLLVIPVVVHVIYNTTAQRISISQVQSQIDVLNEDFNRTNPDTSNTPAIFRSRAGKPNIKFCLAERDPSGNSTDGIIYVNTNVTSFSDNDNIKRSSAGGSDPWDVTKYFNIWVGNLSGGLLGYAEFPASVPSSTYGVVIQYNAFGRTGPLLGAYDRGRTATHEVGHCFDMLHIWGDEPGCTVDDGIDDTPEQKDNNFGCPAFPQDETKPGGCCNPSDVSSMFMNFMDYSDDDCLNMWTADQSTAMNVALQFYKPSLLTSDGCQGFLDVKERSAEAGIRISPNPTEGLVAIEFSEINNIDGTLNVYNSLGETVYSTNISGRAFDLDLTFLPVGMYFIEARSGKHLLSRRLIISK